MEKMQRRATKFIPNGFSDIFCGDRCIQLLLLPLSLRKEMHHRSLIFNCLHEKVNRNISNVIKMVDTNYTGGRFAPKENISFNPFKPEFTIVIFIHYKPRIAIAILDL